MLLGRNESPFPENEHCKRCASKNCRELLVQPLFPGKVIFAHRRHFCSIPDYIPTWRKEENTAPAQEAALTDELEVTEGAIEISSPTWEHSDEENLQDYPEKALEGAKIVLSTQVKNYPEGAPVTFDIYDNSENTPLLIKSIKGTNEGGTATAEWVVEDPQQKGDNLKLCIEASARSKYSQRSDVPYLAKLKCDFVEMPDVLFNHNSAVPCLDTEGIFLGALSSAFIYAKNNPDREAVLFGHTDTSGEPDYNYDLSQWRAEAIQAFINNDVDIFFDTIAFASKVEDYQTFLAALTKIHAWKCDPGKIDNITGEKTKAAIKAFQEEYNKKFNKNLKPDGIMGDKTWTAIFEVTRSLIEETVKKECGEIPSLTYGYNGKGIYPCGESFPVDQIGVDGIKSKTNRRVEIVFFEKGKSAELKAPADKKKVEKKEAPVYDKRYTILNILKSSNSLKKLKTLQLRFVNDRDGNNLPFTNIPVEVEIDNKKSNLTTDSDGYISFNISSKPSNGKVQINFENYSISYNLLFVKNNTKNDIVSIGRKLQSLGLMYGDHFSENDPVFQIALKAFQAKNGLETTGQLDSKTNQLVTNFSL